MSSDALPITPGAFAAALPDLPISTLHLKVLELRNSIAHLDYSNEQLRPFAEGTATATTTTSTTIQSQAQSQPDQDCLDAIRENEGVIERMQERIRLVRAEVEKRGLQWTEFQGPADEGEGEDKKEVDGAAPQVNGDITTGGEDSGAAGRHSAWSDGTFQMGTIRDGVVHMDGVGSGGGTGSREQGQAGGSLTDEELRRRLEEQMRGLGTDGEDEEGGLHL